MMVVRVRMTIMAMLEAFAAKAAFVQLMRLQHGAHAAVEDQDALAQRLLQQGDAFGVKPGQGSHRISFGRAAAVGTGNGVIAACVRAG